MYFFKNTAGNWILGPELTSLRSKVASELIIHTPTNVSVRTIENKVFLIERTEVTAIKKNAEGDFYTSYADFVNGVSGFFADAPASGAKWKTYKALLSQNGEDAPVARVLNQDDEDFLYGLSWLRIAEGTYSSSGVFFDPKMTFYNLSANGDEVLSTACGFSSAIDDDTRDGTYNLLINTFNESIQTDGTMKYYIEIKIRQRGTAPVLLSAETNETGSKVILTFDKKMSGYDLLRAFIDGDSIVIDELGGNQTVSNVIANNNTVEVIFVDNLLANAEYSVQFVPGGPPIESFDYGLLGEIINFPITNNVV